MRYVKKGFLISLFQGRIIDSQTIAILSTITRNKKNIMKSIENMLDCFMDTMNEFEILDNNYAQFCWELLLSTFVFILVSIIYVLISTTYYN